MKPQLTYVSLFSGIEACSVAMSRIAEIDWKPIFFSEIEDFPCRVLKYHFPSVPNLGDVTKIRVETRTNPETNTEEKVITNGHTSIPFPRAGIDILAGGSPCQGFSVAGKRLGLDDPRSCLAMHYARLVEELHPRILFYENVPGMLSSAAAGGPGLDFYAFIRTLVNLGYDDISYRVFDAQYVTVDGFPRAVPQRRKRVFLVGLRSVGRAGADVPASAEILFERASLLGDTPPRREAGQGFAEPPGYRIAGDDRLVEDAAGFGETGRGYWQPGAQCLRAEGESRPSRPGNVAVVGGDVGGSDGRVQHPEGGGARASGTVGGESLGGGGVAPTLISSDYKGPGNTQDGKMIVAPIVMDKEAYNAGENHSAVAIQTMNESIAIYDMTHADEVIREVDGDTSPVLQARMGTGGNQIPLVHVVTHGAIRERIAQICASLTEWPEDDWYSVVPELNLNVFVDMDGKRRATAFLASDENLENGVDIEYVGDGANPTIQNGGTGGTIRQGVCISPDGDKIGKAERAGGSGLGVNTDDVGYTETAKDVHAVAVRTANTHANGHGVAEEATHTLDRASGQAIAVGFKAGQSANGGLGDEREVSPTMTHQLSALEPTVAVGINSPQPHSTTRGFGDDVQPTFGAAAGESGNNKPMVAVAVGRDLRNQSVTGDVSRSLNSAATDSDHLPVAALHHIVRRLTVVECSRLQGFPDWWVRIPVDKWRKIDRDEYDYLAGLGAWYREHIRETGKPGVWETDLSSDSPAYKALGNSWATNCAEWILRRIVAAIRLGRI